MQAFFYVLAISSYLFTNKSINGWQHPCNAPAPQISTQRDAQTERAPAMLERRFLDQSRESPQDLAANFSFQSCKNPHVHDWNN
jgi:hypothetical protein